MGSVKDLIIIESPTEKSLGRGRFVFSDRYSVFDYGEMPDHIDDKGKAICIATAYFFEKLENLGIKTHYVGLVEDDKIKTLYELKKPTNVMEFKMVRVIKPDLKDNIYDYSVFKKEKSNFLIPLEVIYRNSLPEGSSIFKRLKEGSLTLQDIGLEEMPEPGQKLEKPIVDFSTKLEVNDRYLSRKEALEISGLYESEFEKLINLTLFIDDLITEETRKINLNNEDGKVEYALDLERNIMLVDALGTLDECRFTFEGIPVSKEIARIYYRKTDWYKEIEEAKKKDRFHWKDYVSSPPQLPKQIRELISLIYKAYANELTGIEWFETSPLKDLLYRVKELI
ncbi:MULTISPECIES: phosphoribosylaminoimidazolesuccinocarboxamide synthase [Dictyoglomus]|uniref:Phosphoribosylaminoimidazole-succinocarboxamide synthase n=1 Tax=Dictyoglomus turgidum (strain DSM 6724 / Z-1310) TaxID=515635 RepID=B8DYX0_DICTD|nr:MULTISPECIES: phosphoribosylaminoimidazolesuccinocarboxamide synthase [Dictyoglomus]ACK41596.1 phosphoribosylaminoimidazole-succinocarboxamide synthase [Dictyoglomus turgidum DSM 6724]PNV78769.1 MAG: phosphoribosylaminoimidazolesuccinocarboxamide synthase [Dictyoglomus turgidum]HBU31685.1 phosphoribosylaminoimidazolesuccinocarboxamide synthase [Dictyoglomus sp.]